MTGVNGPPPGGEESSERILTTAAFRYRAFISYSHADQKTAKWLHRALESYSVPKRLVGRETATGVIQKRVGTIFRDRDELTVASDLSGEINDALKSTQFLIVLCSPSSARSKWVNQEVVNFKRLKGSKSIIAVILGGEPYASNIAGREADECFCPGLLFHVGEDGRLTDTPAEPIAADLRPGKDSKRLVKMKVLSGLLGVGLDELIRRDNARRQRLMSYAVAASIAGMAVMAGLTAFALRARNSAIVSQNAEEAKRGQAEALIEFMLGDLRQKLEPVGRLDVLDAVGEKVLGYFQSVDPNELNGANLLRRARALLIMGEIDELRGNFPASMSAISTARDITEGLITDHPLDTQYIFYRAQAAYALGKSNWNAGNAVEAEKQYGAYRDLAQKLVSLEPEKASWNSELADATLDLGTVHYALGDMAKARGEFLETQSIYKGIVSRAPADSNYQSSLAGTDGWLADANYALGNLAEARVNRTDEGKLLETLRAADPNSTRFLQSLIINCREIGNIALDLGDVEGALTYARKALALSQQLTERDPNNNFWIERYATTNLDLAELHLEIGQPDAAASYLAVATRTAAVLAPKKAENARWSLLLSRSAFLQGWAALTAGKLETAIERSRSLEGELAQDLKARPGDEKARQLAGRNSLLLGLALKRAKTVDPARAAFERATLLLEPGMRRGHLQSTADFAAATAELGQQDTAREIAGRLLAKGYQRPEFAVRWPSRHGA